MNAGYLNRHGNSGVHCTPAGSACLSELHPGLDGLDEIVQVTFVEHELHELEIHDVHAPWAWALLLLGYRIEFMGQTRSHNLQIGRSALACFRIRIKSPSEIQDPFAQSVRRSVRLLKDWSAIPQTRRPRWRRTRRQTSTEPDDPVRHPRGH